MNKIKLSEITEILLPVLEHTHRYHQFLFGLIFAFVIILNIIFSALFACILNVSPLCMYFSLVNIPNRLVEHANVTKNFSFAAMHDTTS